MRISVLAIGAVASIITINSSFADTTTSTVTSKGYVDAVVGTKQNTIPAANTNSGTPGTSVVMYTNTAGTIGERGIYDGSNTYNSTNDANKLATASALNGAVNNIPTITTSKLTCSNSPDCTLWSIDDQTVYGESNNQQSK